MTNSIYTQDLNNLISYLENNEEMRAKVESFYKWENIRWHQAVEESFDLVPAEHVCKGDLIAFEINGNVWKGLKPVVSITAKGVNVNGENYVCGYWKFSENSEMSFSFKGNGDMNTRAYRLNIL